MHIHVHNFGKTSIGLKSAKLGIGLCKEIGNEYIISIMIGAKCVASHRLVNDRDDLWLKMADESLEHYDNAIDF